MNGILTEAELRSTPGLGKEGKCRGRAGKYEKGKDSRKQQENRNNGGEFRKTTKIHKTTENMRKQHDIREYKGIKKEESAEKW